MKHSRDTVQYGARLHVLPEVSGRGIVRSVAGRLVSQHVHGVGISGRGIVSSRPRSFHPAVRHKCTVSGTADTPCP